MSGRTLSRRGLLVGAAAVALAGGAAAAGVQTGALPGRSWVQREFGSDSSAPGLPDVSPGHAVSGSFRSAARLGRPVGWTVAYPGPHAERLPVVVVLHGRGGTHRSAFGSGLGLDRFLVAGRHRIALASVDGGDTYWHRRATGEDAGAMVVQEFLPLLAGRGLDVSRIGLLGWSMGGYGALWLGGVLGSSRVAAVAAESPALWHRPGDTAPGAFDDPADFAEHDVLTRTAALRGVGVRIDCGTGDGFCPAARDYAAVLQPAPTTAFGPGGHTVDFWRRSAAAQLSFLAARLA